MGAGIQPDHDPGRVQAERRVLVLADSLALTASTGRARRSQLYPRLLTQELHRRTGISWELDLEAAGGWSARGLLLTLRTDASLRSRIGQADAVVLGVGGLDVVASALPFGIGMLSTRHRALQVISSRRVRQKTWNGFESLYPKLVRLTGHRFRHTPRWLLERTWREIVDIVRSEAPWAAIAMFVPPPHRAPLFDGVHHPFDGDDGEIRDLATSLGVAAVDLPSIIAPIVDQLADGTHWPVHVHPTVAQVTADALLSQFDDPEVKPAPQER